MCKMEYKTLLKLCKQKQLDSVLACIATDTLGLLKDSNQSDQEYAIERLKANDTIIKA